LKRLKEDSIDKCDIDEIAGFGYNPSKLFDNKHPQYQENKATVYDPLRKVTVMLV